MAVSAEELIVAIRSEGVNETVDDLEGVGREMEDTAETAGDSADELEDFAARFQGAMAAAVAGLAVGVAGLASSIPVLGEQFAGLSAIFQAFALQIDQLLRDLGAGGLTGLLFETANAINNLEGTAGDLAGAFAIIGAVVGSAATGVALYAVKVMGAKAAVLALVGAVKTAAVTIGAFVAGLSLLTVGLAAAVAAVVAFAVAYLTNFRGVRDTTNEIIGNIVSSVVSGFTTLGSKALLAVVSFANNVRDAFSDLGESLSSWAGNLADDARAWGRNLIQNFIEGIKSALGTLQEWLNELQNVGANVGVDVPDLGGVGGGGGSGRAGGMSGRPAFRAGGTGTRASQIDGRQITESTGRYRSDPNRRRGI